MAATASISPSQQSLSPAPPTLGKDSSASQSSPRTSAQFSPPKNDIPSFNPTESANSLASTGDLNAPQFTSSLPYTQVRDFAYPSIHPLHFGPQPKDPSTAASSERNSRFYDFSSGSGAAWGQEFGRRSSDPAHSSSFASGSEWDDFWGRDGRRMNSSGVIPPPLQFQDGPPWSEDDDLHSPVVRPSRNRSRGDGGLSVSSGHSRGPSGSSAVNGDAKSRRRRSEELYNGNSSSAYAHNGRAQSQLFGGPADAYIQSTQQVEGPPFDENYDSDGEEHLGQGEWDDDFQPRDQSRLSQEFWISIGSPEEEMHGKAVALFDFVRENDNELGLVEGQVIWISYRHGMGWLVAQDPRTGDTGLVPEEYVRLLRDIQQHELDQTADEAQSPITSPESSTANNDAGPSSSPTTKNTPIISTFSTSSQDIYPYPLPYHQPGDQPPPPEQVRSATGSPTVTSQEERVRQIQLERERALMEEEAETPRFGGRKGSVFSTGYREDDEPTPVQSKFADEVKDEGEHVKELPKTNGTATAVENSKEADKVQANSNSTPANAAQSEESTIEPLPAVAADPSIVAKQTPTAAKESTPAITETSEEPSSKSPLTVSTSKVDETKISESSIGSDTSSSAPLEDKGTRPR